MEIDRREFLKTTGEVISVGAATLGISHANCFHALAPVGLVVNPWTTRWPIWWTVAAKNRVTAATTP